MLNRWCSAVLAGCLLVAAPAVNAFAAAGEGIQLGPTLIFPVLNLDATYDSNIHLTSQSEESGWVTTISPSLRFVLPVQRFYINLEGGLDFKSFIDIDQGDYSDWYVGGALGADFPGGLSFKIADRQSSRFLLGSQEYGLGPDQFALVAGENYTVNALNATLSYAIRDALRVELSGGRSDLSYEVSKRRERVVSTVQADLFWKFQPSLSAVLEGSYVDYAYDANTAQDNSAAQAAIGLLWDVTARSTGSVKVGMQWKRYQDEDPALGTENASYYTVAAGLKHTFTPRTILDIELLRASEESDFPENPYYIRNSVDVSLMQRLTTKVYVRGSVRYGVEDYPNEATFDNPADPTGAPETGVRSETSIGWSAAVGFDVTRWLSLKLEYGGGTRDSNFNTFDYDVTRVSFSVKAAF